MIPGWLRDFICDLAGPPKPIRQRLASPPDGTRRSFRVPHPNPLQLICADGDTFFAQGCVTEVTLSFPGEVLLVEYRRLPGTDGGVWYPLDLTGEPQ